MYNLFVFKDLRKGTYLKILYIPLLSILLSFINIGCKNTEPSIPKQSIKKTKYIQNIQVFSTKNIDRTITPYTVEKAFNENGLNISGNNDMNKPFIARFQHMHYTVYNLAMYSNNTLDLKILKKYPNFSVLIPLTFSIWQDQDNNINISTLTINAISRATNIPITDPNLIAYDKLIKKALKAALPNGKFKTLNYNTGLINKPYLVQFTINTNIQKESSPEEYIEDFEAEFEKNIETAGFLIPNFTNIQDEILDNTEYSNKYDYFHTYSICKFDVIYYVSHLHPEAGAWAPCSLYIYKKKNENKMHIGFLGVNNWIKTLNIKDEKSITSLKESQKTIKDIIDKMAK